MRWADLDAFIQEKMKQTGLPGVSLALITQGEITYARGYGFRDLEARLLATPNTVYGIASVSKPFTALAILQLVEEGKLSLEDPIEKFLPISARPFGDSIRIWHLLTHTSGIPALDFIEVEIRNTQKTGKKLWNLAEIISWLNKSTGWAEARPGERWFYLNEGYTLLGAIIEKVSGVPYAEYVRKKIFKPLQMDSTGVLGDHFSEFATPYFVSDTAGPTKAIVPSMVVGSEAGLASTVVDLAKFLNCLLNKGAPLISESTFMEMIKPRVFLPQKFIVHDVESPQYAYGFVVQPFAGRTLIGHPGNITIYTSFIGFIPEEKIGVAVLANAQGYPTAHIAQVALASLLNLNVMQLPFMRLELLKNKIIGIYRSVKGSISVHVQARADAFEMIFRDKSTYQTITMVLERFDENVAIFRTIKDDTIIPATFKLAAESTELVYDCYKFRRVQNSG
jgi:CubicO group peptidase (beta-lactamase class C family)